MFADPSRKNNIRLGRSTQAASGNHGCSFFWFDFLIPFEFFLFLGELYQIALSRFAVGLAAISRGLLAISHSERSRKTDYL
jgi:hypothetical protein